MATRSSAVALLIFSGFGVSNAQSENCSAGAHQCLPEGCIDTALDFANKALSVWNLGGRGHSCTTRAGDCVNSASQSECNCNMWDKPGCEGTDGTGTATDGISCSNTNPAGGAPRALTSDPNFMRFKSVGVAGSMTSSPGSSFDLIVSNLTDYAPYTYQWTFINGEFAQINLNGPRADGDPDISTCLLYTSPSPRDS